MRFVIAAIAVLILANFILLISGERVLLTETLVQPGEAVSVEGFGDLSGNAQASLVCKYWTGRSMVTTVFWYAPNNIFGRDQCPFLNGSEGS
ncbi:hypothetical protein [Aurantiacibacter aquimixticola]|uniref:hypothetical protein n=1 Tax=Aurantiacibacter aquimixticola TaxID=1958945 RepID=UPI000E71CDE9|nr:hypothetical protein [Aurantiacibacter aquimixticola]